MPDMSDRIPFFNINLGHILTIISMLIGGAGAYYGMKSELQAVGYRVERIEANIAQLTALSIVTARQDEKLLNIERRVEHLEQLGRIRQ